ncbi:hypothetical protein Avbf_04479 [Armadillidium vulgare]|nr:hypothetical protein Avbf_04479 [Armadillidium vulgare]
MEHSCRVHGICAPVLEDLRCSKPFSSFHARHILHIFHVWFSRWKWGRYLDIFKQQQQHQ